MLYDPSVLKPDEQLRLACVDRVMMGSPDKNLDETELTIDQAAMLENYIRNGKQENTNA